MRPDVSVMGKHGRPGEHEPAGDGIEVPAGGCPVRRTSRQLATSEVCRALTSAMPGSLPTGWPSRKSRRAGRRPALLVQLWCR